MRPAALVLSATTSDTAEPVVVVAGVDDHRGHGEGSMARPVWARGGGEGKDFAVMKAIADSMRG